MRWPMCVIRSLETWENREYQRRNTWWWCETMLSTARSGETWRADGLGPALWFPTPHLGYQRTLESFTDLRRQRGIIWMTYYSTILGVRSSWMTPQLCKHLTGQFRLLLADKEEENWGLGNSWVKMRGSGSQDVGVVCIIERFIERLESSSG